MVALHNNPPPPATEPAWDIARLFPNQGCWSEWEYLALDTNLFVEFSDGYVEVLPVPTKSHQRIVAMLFDLLRTVVKELRAGGEVILGSYKVRLREGLIREPDITYLAAGHTDWALEEYATGADLVVEVVSKDAESHHRDWEKKRQEYAQAGIPEYWIVDPQLKKIVVLKRVGESYEVHSEAGETGRVASALLPGVEVDAAAVWAAGQVPA